jgi:hypothetical protein
MSTYSQGRPEPIKTIVKRHASGLAHVELVLHESAVPNCTRCSSQRCAEKTNRAVVDAEGALSCRHRMPVSKVNDFVFGPTRAVPAPIGDVEPAIRPLEASLAVIDFFGRNVVLFAWSAESWENEPNKLDAWPIGDSRILILPATEKSPELDVRPWTGRTDRFSTAEKLDVEVAMDGLKAVYTLSLRTDDKAEPSPRAHTLTGKGGIRSVEIVHRTELFRGLNGYSE